MALRMQVYIGLLYQDLIAQHKLSKHGKLPPVLPIVFYHGRRPWRAARAGRIDAATTRWARSVSSAAALPADRSAP
jgi:hypothetical protein